MPYIRIKPYNKRRGCVLRRYSFQNLRLRVGAGWYPVTDVQADYLSTVRMRAGDVYSPKAFDIVDQLEEAKAIEEKEQAEEMRRVWGDAPVRFHQMVAEEDTTLTTKDLAEEESPPPPPPPPEGLPPTPKAVNPLKKTKKPAKSRTKGRSSRSRRQER